MSRLLGAAVLVGLILARPASAQRKSAPDKFERAAGEAFAAAVTADDKGQPGEAIELYERSLELAVHPNTAFNLAAVYERDGKLSRAIVAYEVYLALAPRAADAAAVRTRITGLERTPATMTFVPRRGFSPARAYIVVDGKVVKKPGEVSDKGFSLELSPGRHAIAMVTAVGNLVRYVSMQPGEALRQDLHEEHAHGGNVAITGDGFRPSVLRVAKRDLRVTLPPGRQAVALYDPPFECAPLDVEAPAGDDVLFVHVSSPVQRGRDAGSRCRTFSVTQQRLVFPK